MTPKKVCVLGAGGAIGSRLTQSLVKHGHAVTALVRRLETAVRVARDPIRLCSIDLATSPPERLVEVLKDHDCVIDCTYSTNTDPDIAINESKQMATRLLAACDAADVSNIIHYGTISVYPTGSEKIDESTPCRYQNSAYGDGKLAAETTLLDSKADINVLVLQLPVVLGPFMGWTKTIAGQVVGQTLQMPNDLRGRCDPLFVDDAILATEKAMNLMQASGASIKERILLAGVESVSWNTLYQAHAQVLSGASIGAIDRDLFQQHLTQLRRDHRAWTRLKRAFHEDGDFRQLILAQWGVRTLYRLAKRRRGQAGMDQLKSRLGNSLSVHTAHGAGDAVRTLSPTLVETFDTMPAIDSTKAEETLGFSASIALPEIARISAEWLAWAGLDRA